MKCKVIDQEPIPSIQSGKVLNKMHSGYRVICTKIVIKGTFSCVCIGKKRKDNFGD